MVLEREGSEANVDEGTGLRVGHDYKCLRAAANLVGPIILLLILEKNDDILRQSSP